MDLTPRHLPSLHRLIPALCSGMGRVLTSSHQLDRTPLLLYSGACLSEGSHYWHRLVSGATHFDSYRYGSPRMILGH